MADVNIDINVAAKQALQSLKTIETQARKTTGSFSKLGSAVIVFNQGFQLIRGATRIATGAIGTFIDKAKEIEQIETRFQVLTGSVGQAKKTIQDLQEFAATTPFQLPGIADSAAQLIAFGFEADKITERLQRIGDVAAGSGSSMQEMALIYGQVSAAGKLTGERLLQLQERAVPIGPALAKTMGIAESGVRDAVSKGLVSFDIFEKAFNSLSDASGLFFEGMIKQSKTLGGVFSTLSDNFDLVISDIGQQFLPMIKEVALAIIKWIQANRELIKTDIAAFINGISSAYQTLTGFLKENASALKTAAIAMGTLASGIGAYAIAVNAGTIATVAIGVATTAWATALAIITSPITLVVAAVAALGAGVFLLAKHWDLVTAKTKIWTATILDAVMPAIDLFLNSVGFIVGIFNKSLAQAIENQKTKLRELTETMQEEGENQLAVIEEQNAIKAEIDAQEKADKEAREQAHKDAMSNMQKTAADKSKKLEADLSKSMWAELNKRRKYEDLSGKEKIANFQSTMGTIASLSNTNSKILGGIGKSAAISSATISTYQAANMALTAPPGPPWSFAYVAAVIASGLANVAKIAGVQLGEGGIVQPQPGGVPAILAEKGQPEAVIPLDEAGSFGVTVNIYGDVLDEDSFIDRLVDKINDGVEFRNLQLKTA